MPRRWPAVAGRNRQRRRLPDHRPDHRHEPALRPGAGQRARGDGGDGGADRTATPTPLLADLTAELGGEVLRALAGMAETPTEGAEMDARRDRLGARGRTVRRHDRGHGRAARFRRTLARPAARRPGGAGSAARPTPGLSPPSTARRWAWRSCTWAAGGCARRTGSTPRSACRTSLMIGDEVAAGDAAGHASMPRPRPTPRPQSRRCWPAFTHRRQAAGSAAP